MGGSSKDGKMSKLAALAAKRRQKESAVAAAPERLAKDEPQDEYAASLSKLSLSSELTRKRTGQGKDDDIAMKDGSNSDVKDVEKEDIEALVIKNPDDEPIVQRTNPSAFAGTFLGNASLESAVSSIDPTLLKDTTSAYDFKDPSPDDVVYKAQTGRTR